MVEVGTMKKIAVMLACAGVFALAGSKDRDWQTGKVLDNQFNPYFAPPNANASKGPEGMLGNSDYSVNSASNNANAEQIRDNYVIETDDAAYMVERVRLKMS